MTERTAEEIEASRPGGKSLAESYELHDVGHEMFVERCDALGFEVEPWGIDERDHAGDQAPIYDDKMDFKVYRTIGIGGAHRELAGLVDVKTKSSAKWMGQFNLRHYEDYVECAEEEGVPAFIIMMHVDGDEVVDWFVFEIEGTDEEVMRSDEDGYVSTFPDGNHKAVVRHHKRENFDYFIRTVS